MRPRPRRPPTRPRMWRTTSRALTRLRGSRLLASNKPPTCPTHTHWVQSKQRNNLTIRRRSTPTTSPIWLWISQQMRLNTLVTPNPSVMLWRVFECCDLHPIPPITRKNYFCHFYIFSFSCYFLLLLSLLAVIALLYLYAFDMIANIFWIYFLNFFRSQVVQTADRQEQ